MPDRSGPWRYDDVAGLIDFGSDEWHGGKKPPDIEPGVAPGGVVFVVLRADGSEVERAPVSSGSMKAPLLADRHGSMCAADPTLRLVVYDGDSGRPALVMAAPR